MHSIHLVKPEIKQYTVYMDKVFMLGRKKVGELREGVFRKQVDIRIHLLRKYDAWALSKKILDELPDSTTIEITEKKGKVYLINAGRARLVGIPVKENGFEAQLAIPRKYFI